MKKLNILIILTSICLLSVRYEQSQRKYYYSGSEKIFLHEETNKLVVTFDEKYLSKIRQYLQDNAQIRSMESGNFGRSLILTTIEKINNQNIYRF